MKNTIKAFYNQKTIRVYQAYPDNIAELAIERGTFISPPFKMDRMTWIKPSFLWMMYRSGWGLKEPGQSRILAIDITLAGFEWALTHSCLSRRPPQYTQEEWKKIKEEKPVRIQWDPERDIFLNPLPYRTIQIGLSNEAVRLYIADWIKKITDITPLAHEIHSLLTQGKNQDAQEMLPIEKVYTPPKN